MTFIRAHFDGRVVIPDEPVQLPAHSKVMVLIDADPVDAATLAQATREYYQQQSAEERAEDEAWGEAIAGDAAKAWE